MLVAARQPGRAGSACAVIVGCGASAEVGPGDPGLVAGVLADVLGLALEVAGRPAGAPGHARLALGVDRGQDQPAEHREVLRELERWAFLAAGSDSPQNA